MTLGTAAPDAVRIVDLGGKRVGTATVGTSGTFSARVTAPRTAAQRARVGYRAIIGRLRSPAVKLGQVNTLRTVARSGDTVTLRDRITGRDNSRFRTVAAYGGSGDCPTTNKRLETVGTPTINRRRRHLHPAGAGPGVEPPRDQDPRHGRRGQLPLHAHGQRRPVTRGGTLGQRPPGSHPGGRRFEAPES